MLINRTMCVVVMLTSLEKVDWTKLGLIRPSLRFAI